MLLHKNPEFSAYLYCPGNATNLACEQIHMQILNQKNAYIKFCEVKLTLAVTVILAFSLDVNTERWFVAWCIARCHAIHCRWLLMLQRRGRRSVTVNNNRSTFNITCSTHHHHRHGHHHYHQNFYCGLRNEITRRSTIGMVELSIYKDGMKDTPLWRKEMYVKLVLRYPTKTKHHIHLITIKAPPL